jgi:hypothetical protein
VIWPGSSKNEGSSCSASPCSCPRPASPGSGTVVAATATSADSGASCSRSRSPAGIAAWSLPPPTAIGAPTRRRASGVGDLLEPLNVIAEGQRERLDQRLALANDRNERKAGEQIEHVVLAEMHER